MLNELEALVVLSSIPTLGSVKIRALIQHFGSALAVLDAKEEILTALPEIGSKAIPEWKTWRRNGEWQRNLELVEQHRAQIIPYTHPLYPKRLLELPDFPVLLYVKGDLLPSDQNSIAVVGTRQASIYGKEMAERMGQDLAASNLAVVSGLARGIDTAAHIGALRKGRTIAVIGSGLADIYPQENKALAQAISERGALMSEFPMLTPPDRQNFPQRNRIVAGMTLGSLLVEAPVKSGAMLTMERALLYKRKLFAFPGRADNENFRGNHFLIKNGHAQLVENVRDVLNSFNHLFNVPGEQKNNRIPPQYLFDAEEEKLLKVLPNHEFTIDEIAQMTKYPVMKISVLIMSLMLKKAVKEYPGKLYKKVKG